MNQGTEPSESCLNCQAKLDGPFCGQCGQARSARLVPFREWVGDFVGTFFKLDSKILRTLKKVLFQPGQATIDFGKGQRVSYAGPAKTYIIVSAISIALMTLTGGFGKDTTVPGMVVEGHVQKTIQFIFPFVNLLSPLVTAVVLAILQPRFYFQLHLAFSLHVWTFFVAVTTPTIFLPLDEVLAAAVFLSLIATTGIYLFWAHLRVYAMTLFPRSVICAILIANLFLTALFFAAVIYGIAVLIS